MSGPPAVPRTVIFQNMSPSWDFIEVKAELEQLFGPVEDIEKQVVSEDLDLCCIRVVFQQQAHMDTCLAENYCFTDENGRTSSISDYRPTLAQEVFPLVTWGSTDIGIAPQLINAFDAQPAQLPPLAPPLSPASTAWVNSPYILMGGPGLPPAPIVRKPCNVVFGPRVRLTDIKMGLPKGLESPTRTPHIHPLFFIAVDNTTAGAIRRLRVPANFEMRDEFAGQWPSGVELVVVVEVVAGLLNSRRTLLKFTSTIIVEMLLLNSRFNCCYAKRLGLTLVDCGVGFYRFYCFHRRRSGAGTASLLSFGTIAGWYECSERSFVGNCIGMPRTSGISNIGRAMKTVSALGGFCLEPTCIKVVYHSWRVAGGWRRFRSFRGRNCCTVSSLLSLSPKTKKGLCCVRTRERKEVKKQDTRRRERKDGKDVYGRQKHRRKNISALRPDATVHVDWARARPIV
ncbi:hypothetical protein BDZ88DRAFT_492386 [Geranomyces variabilis]|nr:hypothetical protein BDZ88DRAFT_492386 [Geranomyces variabilis]